MKADDVMRLSMTGEQITGARAAEVGLATEAVDEPIKAALDLIAAISERSPDSVAATKKLLYANRRGSLRAGLAARAQAAGDDVQVGQHQDRPRGGDGQAAGVVQAPHVRLGTGPFVHRC